jgi:hypothetical protein
LTIEADLAPFGGATFQTRGLCREFNHFLLFTRRTLRVLVEPSLRIDPKDLSLSLQTLGQGASCEVIAGVYHDTPVAVKRFHARANNILLPAVGKEVAVLSLLRHPSIVVW